MPIVNEGIKKELGHISRPFELEHITEMFEKVDPIMQEMAYSLVSLVYE